MLHSAAEWIVPNVSSNHSGGKKKVFYNFKKSGDHGQKESQTDMSFVTMSILPEGIHSQKNQMILHNYRALWIVNCVITYTEAENCHETRVNWK